MCLRFWREARVGNWIWIGGTLDDWVYGRGLGMGRDVGGEKERERERERSGWGSATGSSYVLKRDICFKISSAYKWVLST